jgi:hypothetical protein
VKRYSWKAGRHPAVSAQAVGQWLEALPDRRPETILEASRARKSPVHAYFWKLDEKAAAKEYRLLLARLMLASLTVDVVIYERNKPRTIQAQAIMHSSRDGDYDYVADAMTEPVKRDFILSQAMAELQATKRRYAHLSELAVVFSAIERVSKRVRKSA